MKRRGGERQQEKRPERGNRWLTVYLIDEGEGGHVNAVNVMNGEGRQRRRKRSGGGGGRFLTFVL